MYKHKINFINGQSIVVFSGELKLEANFGWLFVDEGNKYVHVVTRNVLFTETDEIEYVFNDNLQKFIVK